MSTPPPPSSAPKKPTSPWSHAEHCPDANEAGSSAEDDEQYQQTLAAQGLDNSRMSATSLIDDSTVVIIGFVTSLLQVRISSMAPANRQTSLVLMIGSITVLLFAALRQFVTRVCYFLWRHNRNWCSVVLRVVQFVRAAALFLVTHSVSSAILLLWDESQMSWLETFAISYILVVTIYFIVEVLHRTR